MSLEVIDLRTLVPWDRDAVLASVKKTTRALVLHEAPLTGGFGGEVAAAIGQEAFAWLDAPVTRVAGLDMPVPFSKALEEMLLAEGAAARRAPRGARVLTPGLKPRPTVQGIARRRPPA